MPPLRVKVKRDAVRESRGRILVRGVLSLALFAVFGLGAIPLSLAALVLRTPERMQPLVRFFWRPVLGLFRFTRLMRLVADAGTARDLAALRGTVIAANHPSLIDVMLFVCRTPRTLYVAKRALRHHPLLGAIVRATSLPDTADLPEVAASYLARGWNVLLFPEGTRSPREGGLGPFHRGAAQVALRSGAPLVCVAIALSRRVLAKGQPPWDVGDEPVTYTLRMSVPPRPTGGVSRQTAVAYTESVRAEILGLITSETRDTERGSPR